MGMIFKRGNIYWLKYYKNGKPFYETTRSKKVEDAKRLLKKREGEIAEGKQPGVIFNKIRYEELAENIITDYKVNGQKSIKRVENSIKHLKEFFEGCRVPDITTSRIKKYIEFRLDEGAENGTINRELAALRRMLNLGRIDGKVCMVPHVPMLKENNVREGFFEHGDFLALRDALPEYLRGFVTFAYKTGWRVSEIRGLCWKQVDINQGIVRLEPGTTKNKKGRVVYLDAELQEVFKVQWENRKKAKKISHHVFPGKDGIEPIKDFRGAWEAACTEAKIGVRLFHDFRRTAVRNMVRAGISDLVAMMISGHKTRSVFDRYNIGNDADLRNAAVKQEEYLQKQMVEKTDGDRKVTVVDFQKKAAVAGTSQPIEFSSARDRT